MEEGRDLRLLGTRRTTPPLDPGRRWVLVALRALAYTFLLLVLASPVLNRQRDLEQRARIAILVDDSASMSSVDTPTGPMRSGRVRDVVRTVREALGDAPAELEVVPFASEPLPPLAPDAWLASADSARGAGTDVLQRLGSTADRSSGDNLQAMVLVSDGRATRGVLDPGSAAALGTPVFAVGIGDTLPARDLALGRVDANPIAYVESETEIVVRVDGGSELVLRADDRAEVIVERLKTYHAKTEPLIAHYAAKGTLFVIDGNGTSEATFAQVRQVLDAVVDRSKRGRD